MEHYLVNYTALEVMMRLRWRRIIDDSVLAPLIRHTCIELAAQEAYDEIGCMADEARRCIDKMLGFPPED